MCRGLATAAKTSCALGGNALEVPGAVVPPLGRYKLAVSGVAALVSTSGAWPLGGLLGVGMVASAACGKGSGGGPCGDLSPRTGSSSVIAGGVRSGHSSVMRWMIALFATPG